MHWIRPEDTTSGCVTVNEPKCPGGGDEGEKPLPGWLCSRPPTELCVHAPTDRPRALCLLQGHCCPGRHSQMCPTPPRVPTHRGLPCLRTLADQPGTGPSTFRDRAAHIWSEIRWVLQTKEKAPGWGQSLCPFVRAPDNTPCSGPRCHRSGLLGSVNPSPIVSLTCVLLCSLSHIGMWDCPAFLLPDPLRGSSVGCGQEPRLADTLESESIVFQLGP